LNIETFQWAERTADDNEPGRRGQSGSTADIVFDRLAFNNKAIAMVLEAIRRT
jgi:hypothetical protein